MLTLLDRRPEARAVLAALVGDFPDRARPRMMLADLLMTRAPPDPQGALEQYEAVLRNNPGDSRARAGAAASRLRLGVFERAAAEMSGLLAVSPGKTHLAFLLGTAHHWLGEYEAAIAAYRKALDSTPKGAREPQRMKWNLRLAYLGLHGDYPGDLPADYQLTVADLGEDSPVAFRDVAEALGVAKRDRGRGNAWGDFDGDGDLDLFSTGIQVPHSLYRNESGAQFTDVTAAAGLGDPRGGWSATAVDYDNDGDLDLYATRDAWEGKAPNSLYRNLGSLRFGEVGDEAGVGDPDDSFTAAWGDVDNDGRVDLYVAEGITGGGTPNKLFLNPAAASRTGRTSTGSRTRASRSGWRSATTTATATSTCTSPTSPGRTPSTATNRDRTSPTSPRAPGWPSRRRAATSPFSPTSTATAPSTCSSPPCATTSSSSSRRSPAGPWAATASTSTGTSAGTGSPT